MKASQKLVYCIGCRTVFNDALVLTLCPNPMIICPVCKGSSEFKPVEWVVEFEEGGR